MDEKETSEYTTRVVCPLCGSTNQDNDETWRWNGKYWEHRCADVHQQVGHRRVPQDERNLRSG